MIKKTSQLSKKDALRAANVKKTARVLGVSENLVQKVLRGDRFNDQVMLTYFDLVEGEQKLLEDVKKLVPFNQ